MRKRIRLLDSTIYEIIVSKKNKERTRSRMDGNGILKLISEGYKVELYDET